MHNSARYELGTPTIGASSPITLDDLPPDNTRRWVARRKATVVAAVRSELITLEDACRRYTLSVEEYLSWERAIEKYGLPGLRVTGIMTMAPFTSDQTTLREAFRMTRRIFERCAERVPSFEPRVLSMGMSNDFEIAVEEGSTRVRLGTTLLGERPAP